MSKNLFFFLRFMFLISSVGKMIFTWVYCALFSSSGHLVCSTEQQLIRKLLQYYEPSVRPVLQAQAIVNISFRMEITQLFELVSECIDQIDLECLDACSGRKDPNLNDQCTYRTEMDRRKSLLEPNGTSRYTRYSTTVASDLAAR